MIDNIYTPAWSRLVKKMNAAKRRTANASKLRRKKKHYREFLAYENKMSRLVWQNFEKNPPALDPREAAKLEKQADHRVVIINNFSKLTKVQQELLMDEYAELLVLNGSYYPERTLQAIRQQCSN